MDFADFGKPLDARSKVTFISVSLYGLRLDSHGHRLAAPHSGAINYPSFNALYCLRTSAEISRPGAAEGYQRW